MCEAIAEPISSSARSPAVEHEVAQHLRAIGRVLQDHAGDVARQLLKIGLGGPK